MSFAFRPRALVTPAVVLLAIAACLDTRRGGQDCACGLPASGERGGSPSSAAPTADPAPMAPAPPAAASNAAPRPGPAPEARPAPAGGLPDFSDPSWTRTPSLAGRYLVCWRSTTGRVPRNEDFELEVWVLRDAAPVPGAILSVSAWMPEHGHGMLRQARVEERPDGSYRVVGMLLHMRGLWQLHFDVIEGTLSEMAEAELEL